MTDAAWAILSQQAIFAAGTVYFLALLAYLGQWSILRSVPVSATVEASVEVPAASVGGSAPPAAGETAVTVPVPEPQRSAFLGRLGLLLTGLATFVHVVGVVTRGLAADPNRVPWSNMYEFTISGTMMLALLFLAGYRRFSLSWLGPIIAAFNVTVLMIAVRVLYAPVAPLADPLDSYWLVIHVVSAIIATAAFTLGGITSILYLLKARSKRADRGYLARLPQLKTLDLISYRIHAFAFPVWTFAVLITGPIWAYHAWSQYWQWDPKEVWAFITWVVYAAYLHARTTAGWKGRRAAWIAILGLSTLLFNAVVVNYFVDSQHSYAKSAPAIVVPADIPAPGAGPGDRSA